MNRNQHGESNRGSWKTLRREGRGVQADFGTTELAVSVLAEGIIRVRWAKSGAIVQERPWTTTAPEADFEPVEFSLTESDGRFAIETRELQCRLDREEGMSIKRRNGDPLLSDFEGTGPRWHSAGIASSQLQVPEDIHVYGLGERTGLLEKSGRRWTCWTYDAFDSQSPATDEMYKAIPFFLVLDRMGQSFAVFLNNTHRTSIDLSNLSRNFVELRIDGGDMDYFFIHGPDPLTVLARFTAITGRMPLPSLWALGYHQARWSYASSEEVLRIAREFRARNIPADVLYLDIDYMDEFKVFTWNSLTFPEPKKLVSELHDLRFRVIAMIDPAIKYQPDGGYSIFDEGVAGDFFIRESTAPDAPYFKGYVWPGKCVLPDFARTEVRRWWASHLEALLEVGLDGFVNDLNEPTMHDRPYDDPAGIVIFPAEDAPQGGDELDTFHAEVHNVYANLEAQATVDAFDSKRGRVRPFILTRAAGSGAQRYAATWTGDNSSSWEHLEMSLPQLLNLGISGMAFCGADIGGFLLNCSTELLVRWFQLGAFYPLARNNSAKGTHHQEPWARGPEVEMACRKALELRYELLPYLYTLFEEASRTGTPVLRPLFLHYPSDPRVRFLHDEALVGDSILIAPVLRPGLERRLVYLPKGTWYDLRTGQIHGGPDDILADAPLYGTLPIYAKAGSIIATSIGARHAADSASPTLKIFENPSGMADGTLYEDDGESLNYKLGAFRREQFDYVRAGEIGRLQIQVDGKYPSGSASRNVEIYCGKRIFRGLIERMEGDHEIEVPLV
jgi:alpha-glucosidase